LDKNNLIETTSESVFFVIYLLPELQTGPRWIRIRRETSFLRRNLCVATSAQPGKFFDWNSTGRLPAQHNRFTGYTSQIFKKNK